MGNTISSISLTFFEILNELFVATASGVLGISILVYHGISTSQICRTLLVTTITVGSLVYVFQINEKCEPCEFKVVVITGCDSGLGFSLAHHVCENGFTVFAGFLNLESKGALELQRIFGGKIRRLQVDITDSGQVRGAVDVVERFLKNNTEYGKYLIDYSIKNLENDFLLQLCGLL